MPKRFLSTLLFPEWNVLQPALFSSARFHSLVHAPLYTANILPTFHSIPIIFYAHGKCMCFGMCQAGTLCSMLSDRVCGCVVDVIE